MKISRTLLLVAIASFGINQLFGQTTASNISAIKSFGIGLHLEQFKYKNVSDFNSAPANKVVLTFNPTSSFRIEPEIGFRSGKNTTTDLKNSSLNVGLGLFKMIQRHKLNMYGGIRLEYADIHYEITILTFESDINAEGPWSTDAAFTTNRFTIGPTIGCEYFLGDNFTIGGEVVIKYATLKTSISPKPKSYEDQESYYYTADTGLFVRFYF